MSKFRQVVGECIGEASMCWSERPTGVFDSSRASQIVDKIFDTFHLEAGMNVSRWVQVVRENAQLKNEIRTLKVIIQNLKSQANSGSD